MRRLTGKMPDFSVYIAAIAAPYLFCVLAGMLLGRCDAALRRLILACLWAAMLGSEGVKLAVLWSGNVQPPYVPLHFSSTFHLSVGLAVCARGRAKHAGQALLFAGGLIMTAMIAVCPVSVLGDPLQMFSSHVHAHGYFFHMQVALQFFALVFSGEYTIRPLDGHIFAVFLAAWACPAVPGSFLLGVNYMGILRPYIPFFRPLPDACGYPLYLTVYYACAVLAVWAGLYALSFLQRRVRSKRRKILIAFR
mgnify:FL=1